MKRLFIAVNLPEKTRNTLAEYQEKYKELPGTWTKKENLHVTLAFLGNKSEQEEQKIQNILKETAKKHAPFAMHFSRIVYGPPKTTPRMIWAIGPPASEAGDVQREFLSLSHDIEKELAASSVLRFEQKQQDKMAHLTLLRLDQWQFAKMEPEERPLVNEDIDISFHVNSIELMESKLKRGGAEYSVIETIPLKT